MVDCKQKQQTANSTYPKGGVSCSKDSFVVTRTFVLLMHICGESPALRVAAKRCNALKINVTKRLIWRIKLYNSDNFYYLY